MVVVVAGRHAGDFAGHLVARVAGRANYRLVRHVLRHDSVGFAKTQQHVVWRFFEAGAAICAAGGGVCGDCGAAGIFRAALHFPLARGDDGLLSGALGQGAPYRGRFTAYSGRHDALCEDYGGFGREFPESGADAGGVFADFVGFEREDNGNTVDWACGPCAGVFGGAVFAVRHGGFGFGGREAAGAGIQ